MFFTIPPSLPHELGAPDYLKAITLRVTEIQPAGFVYIYFTPFPGMPVRFDAEHYEQRLPADRPLIWTQLQDGAETFRLELVSFEADKEAAARANEPQPMRMRPDSF